MGFYSQVIFPRLIDLTMSTSPMGNYRQDILSDVQGEVLEIGFGTGLNLPYYPKHIKKITVIEPNPGMKPLAGKRIQKSDIKVENFVLQGEELPFADESFDSVVSTWTLCSIANIDQALRQIHRVLKPEGRFFVLEHGLSDDPKVEVWQNRLNPIQKVVGDGCHLNRNIKQLIENNQFKFLELEQFYMADLPKFVGYMYKGIATK